MADNIIIPQSQRTRLNVRRITYRDLVNSSTQLNQLNYIKAVFKQYVNQTVKVAYQFYEYPPTATLADPILNEDEKTVDIPSANNYNKWWTGFSLFLFPGSEDFIFDPKFNPPTAPPKLQTQLLILTQNKIQQEKLIYEQYFLDGTTHCVFHPIYNWAIDKAEQSKTTSTRQAYEAMSNAITKKYLDKYKNGLPEADLQEICDKLRIDIEIDVPSTSVNKKANYIRVNCQKAGKSRKLFRYINTRLNHLELNEISSKDDYIEESQEFLNDIVEKYTRNKEFLIYKGDRGNVYQVNLPDKIYKLTEQEGYRKETQKFIWENNLLDYKIEHYSNLKLSQFLLDNLNKNGNIIFDEPFTNIDQETYFREVLQYPELSTKDKKQFKSVLDNPEGHAPAYLEELKWKNTVLEYIDSLNDMNHIDMKKAYTRGMESSFYQGYLGKITDFRKTKKIVGLGIYMIYNISQKSIPEILKKLDMFHEYNCYTSPELEYYQSLGIEFEICCGCWGSAVDIDFGEDYEKGMYQKGKIGNRYISHYCKWYGCNHKLSEYDRYNFTCKDIKFAQLNTNDDCEIRYNEEENVGIIEYPKEKAFHSAHISIFIHGYCSIAVVEQLMKFKDINQVFAVQVDGIYYKGDVEVGKLFSKDKSGKISSVYGNQFIANSFNDKNYYKDLPKFRENNLIEVHVGPGGCGKTYKNLTDTGLVAPLYIGHSWKLSRNKSKEFNIDCTCHYHTADTTDPTVYRRFKQFYNTLIFDEASCISQKQKKIILNRFPDHKIIFCGDIGYQLPPIPDKSPGGDRLPEEFRCENLTKIRHYPNKDISKRRCKCEKLDLILKDLRKKIKKYEDWDEDIFTKYGFEIIDKDTIHYNVNDLILAYTHSNKDYYTEKYKHMKKYLIKRTTALYSASEIIVGDLPDGQSGVIQHAFTVHSVQGESIKSPNKLFIDVRLFYRAGYRMLYTALSRAERFDQIVLIH